MKRRSFLKKSTAFSLPAFLGGFNLSAMAAPMMRRQLSGAFGANAVNMDSCSEDEDEMKSSGSNYDSVCSDMSIDLKEKDMFNPDQFKAKAQIKKAACMELESTKEYMETHYFKSKNVVNR